MTGRLATAGDVEVLTLTRDECSRLSELEAVVERGLQTFVEVGLALLEIRDARLYRETHATFEAYLDERFGISRSRGYRLIDGARVAELVSPMGDIPNERQARELVPLLREGETEVVEVYRELRGAYGPALTAELVRNAVRKRLDHERERQERAESRDRERQEREPAEKVYAAAVRDFHAFVAQWERWCQLPMPSSRMTPFRRVFKRVACRNVPGVPRALAEIYEEVHTARRRFLDEVAVLAEEHERELRARVEPHLARVREAVDDALAADASLEERASS